MSINDPTGPSRKTPGVYIDENPPPVGLVSLPSAAPIFIGYTQFAEAPGTGAPLYNKPFQISSMAEFSQCFGAAHAPTLRIAPKSEHAEVPDTPAPAAGPPAGEAATAPFFTFIAPYTISGGVRNCTFEGRLKNASDGAGRFNLFWTMQLYFANGGGSCFVVSVGDYGGQQLANRASAAPLRPGTIKSVDLLVGLAAAGEVKGPTMVVAPEACQLDSDAFAAVVQAMLQQAATLQDRMAILDPPGCLGANSLDLLKASQSALWSAIAPQAANLSYGVAYAPALITPAAALSDTLYTNVVADEGGGNTIINNILTTQALQLYSGAALASVHDAIAAAFPVGLSNTGARTGSGGAFSDAVVAPEATPQQQAALQKVLLDALPVYKQIQQIIVDSVSIAPPSGIMAGVWVKTDAAKGVWNAPADVALSAGISPICEVGDGDEAGFNIPANGQAVNLVRIIAGRGTLVRGARMLDGDSSDYRYIQVRRTLLTIEQSIKTAVQAYVFRPNVAATWATVIAEISDFLQTIWAQGGLLGSTSAEAFSVLCGLGSTMTSQNITDGYMVVQINLALIRPGAFMELTFSQAMGS